MSTTATALPPAPSAPIQDPFLVAPGTWVVPELFEAPPFGFTMMSSMVIAGAEPVLVDTGTARNHRRWTEAVFSIVEPEDVRWVFLSHDDHDHVGNLLAVLDACPRATLVTTWFSLERLRGDYEIPLARCRWVNDGESFDAGDRTLVALRPPIYDAPTTRGLFDARTRCYWAVDSFASPVPGPTADAAELDRTSWEEMQLLCNRIISPWHELLDRRRFDRTVDALAALDPRVLALAHGPAVRGELVNDALRLVREVAGMPPAALPGQADLEDALAAAGIT